MRGRVVDLALVEANHHIGGQGRTVGFQAIGQQQDIVQGRIAHGATTVFFKVGLQFGARAPVGAEEFVGVDLEGGTLVGAQGRGEQQGE